MSGRRTSIAPGAVPQQAGRTTYGFSDMRTVDIVACMDDLRASVSEAELAKPTHAVAQRVFEALLETFTGARAGSHVSRAASALEGVIERPELYADALGLMVFGRALSRLMAQLGVDDFSLRDVVRPEPARFRAQLVAVAGFGRFREQQLALYESLSRRAAEASEQHMRLARRVEELTARVARVRARHAEEEPSADALRSEIAQMVQTLREQKREQTALSGELDALKTHKGEAGERLAQTQLLLGSVRTECVKLRSRVVHSPERLQQMLAELSAAISGERNALAVLERRSRELQMRLDALGAAEAELGRTVAGMETLRGDVRRRDELRDRTHTDGEAVTRAQLSLRDLEIREAQLARQLIAAEEKAARLSSATASRRDRAAGRLAELHAQYATVCAERAAGLERVEAADRGAKDYEARTAALRETHYAEIATIRTDCVALKARLASYTEDIRKGLVL